MSAEAEAASPAKALLYGSGISIENFFMKTAASAKNGGAVFFYGKIFLFDCRVFCYNICRLPEECGDGARGRSDLGKR